MKTSTALQAKFAATRSELSAALIERDDEIDLALTALVAQEHVLLVGPPGTGKSLLLDSLLKWTGGTKFSVLLTKFSVPEELFGPVSVVGLKDDKYHRITTGRMPEADFAFVDEALALDTPIPTPGGWKMMGDLKPGDEVYGSDGQPTHVKRVTPVQTGHPCFRVKFRDGGSIVADAGHNWYCMPARNVAATPWRVMTTGEMAGDNRVNQRFHLPLPEPLAGVEQELPIDPYVFGLWLGNGNHTNAELYIRTEWADRTLAEVQAVYPEASLGRTLPGLRVVSLAGTKVRTVLREIGAIANKYVPDEYLKGTVEQRRRLLCGLMDSDGYMNEYGVCVFSNTIPNIVNTVRDLARSLGMAASVCEAKDDREGANGPHKTCWKVTFRASPKYPCFISRGVTIPAEKRKRHMLVESVEPVESVPVRCIEVEADDHLFVAGRSMVLTHNCFKASSAILNTLLKLLNERTFDAGDGVSRPVPLKLCVAASNEWPNPETGKELGALFDRFVLRKTVRPIVSAAGRKRLLWDRDHAPKLTTTVTPAEIAQAHREARALPWSDAARGALETVLKELAKEGVQPGDRRQYKAVGVAQAFAWVNGAARVEPEHLEVLAAVLWDDPQEQPDVTAKVIARVANPVGMRVNQLLLECESILAGCDVRKLADAATATAKLGEVCKQLDALTGNGRLEKARAYVRGEIKKLKLASIEAY